MRKTEKVAKAVRLRDKISSERPDFNRSETHRFPRLGEKWRSSKGIRSKMRLKKRSRAAIVETGYRGPTAARGLRSDGKSEILVSNVKDLTKVNLESQVARIDAAVGKRKRLEIIDRAKELKIKIVNIHRSEKPTSFAEKPAEASKKAEKKVEQAPEEEKEEAKTIEEEEE
ncbi:MAG: 50S ribosomal protein L32e [Candidatus Methanomethylicaceae archaeon]|jgi:large subunit ribosomal protein L32e